MFHLRLMGADTYPGVSRRSPDAERGGFVVSTLPDEFEIIRRSTTRTGVIFAREAVRSLRPCRAGLTALQPAMNVDAEQVQVVDQDHHSRQGSEDARPLEC